LVGASSAGHATALPRSVGPQEHGEPLHDHTTACDADAPAGNVVDVVDVVEVLVVGVLDVVEGGTVVVVDVLDVVEGGNVVVLVVVDGPVVEGGGGDPASNVYANTAVSFCTLSTSAPATPDTVNDWPANNVAKRRCDDAPGAPA
jgi:hypothetical protein